MAKPEIQRRERWGEENAGKDRDRENSRSYMDWPWRLSMALHPRVHANFRTVDSRISDLSDTVLADILFYFWLILLFYCMVHSFAGLCHLVYSTKTIPQQ